MAHDIDKEKLSAYLDGELSAAELPELSAHLKTCAECSAYVERLKNALADFKKFGAEKTPEAVLARALEAGGKKAKSRRVPRSKF